MLKTINTFLQLNDYRIESILFSKSLIFFSALVFFALLKLILFIKQNKSGAVFLQLISTRNSGATNLSSEQLLNVIHTLLKQRSLLFRVVGIHKYYSLEIVSTKDEGIWYLVKLPSDDVDIFRKALQANLPNLNIKESPDYLKDFANTKVFSVCQSRNYLYPLRAQEKLVDFDPMALISGSMGKLAEDELMAIQLVVKPLSGLKLNTVTELRKVLLKKGEVLADISNETIFEKLFRIGSKAFVQVLMLPVGLLVWVFSGGQEGPVLNLGGSRYKKNAYSSAIDTQIKEKIDQNLYEVSFRLLIKTSSKSRLSTLKRGFQSSLAVFSNNGHQALVISKFSQFNLVSNIERFLFSKRLGGVFSSLVFSATELSSLYHFPVSSLEGYEDLVTLKSKELPAPLSLKKNSKLDIEFAINTYGGVKTPVGLSEEERKRHTYIIGATGTGKSSLLNSMISQDVVNGKGLCLVDPHGDLAKQVISNIPESRLKDVIYFDPSDLEYPIGLNLLELTPGLSTTEALMEREFVAESVVSLFKKIYPERYSGPRMEYILRNAIHTAFYAENPTLFSIYKLLTNNDFRKEVVAKLPFGELKDFWKYEFNKAGAMQVVAMISPITNKIGRFLFSEPLKRVLGQDKSSINLEDVMDEGKILICNFSKGVLGEDASEVFGIAIIAKLQLAAMARAKREVADRRLFNLYVDEFQNFVTPAFAQILSESRKYGLAAVLAHQTTAQIEEKDLLQIILANVGNIICFRTGSPEDEKVILPQFIPLIAQGEISSLPPFCFYMKKSGVYSEDPFSGTTVISVNTNIENSFEKVILSSRKLYGKKYVEAVRSSTESKPVNNRTTKNAF